MTIKKKKSKNYLKVSINQFWHWFGINTAKDEKIYDSAKQCALIAAKEVLNEIPISTIQIMKSLRFWIYTIEEINKLWTQKKHTLMHKFFVYRVCYLKT
jgi:hypothetical protein